MRGQSREFHAKASAPRSQSKEYRVEKKNANISKINLEKLGCMESLEKYYEFENGIKQILLCVCLNCCSRTRHATEALFSAFCRKARHSAMAIWLVGWAALVGLLFQGALIYAAVHG